MPETLEQVIADFREKATTLRSVRHAHEAELIEDICTAVTQAAGPFLRCVSESDAMLFSGKGAAWLRARFPDWEQRRLAEWRDGKRYYRLCALPHRPDLAQAREEGLRGATSVRRSA